MDEESASLLCRVYQSCSSLCVILVTDQDFKGNPIYP